jgi:hypothetical protein
LKRRKKSRPPLRHGDAFERRGAIGRMTPADGIDRMPEKAEPRLVTLALASLSRCKRRTPEIRAAPAIPISFLFHSHNTIVTSEASFPAGDRVRFFRLGVSRVPPPP